MELNAQERLEVGQVIELVIGPVAHGGHQNSELKTKFSLLSATQLLFAVTTSFPALSQRVH